MNSKHQLILNIRTSQKRISKVYKLPKIVHLTKTTSRAPIMQETLVSQCYSTELTKMYTKLKMMKKVLTLQNQLILIRLRPSLLIRNLDKVHRTREIIRCQLNKFRIRPTRVTQQKRQQGQASLSKLCSLLTKTNI